VLIFCFFLFNDKKKARPAGQNQSAVAAKKTLGGNAEPKKPRAGQTQALPLQSTKNHHPGGFPL